MRVAPISIWWENFNEGNQPVIRWQHLLKFDWTYQNWGAGVSNHLLSRYVDYAPEADGRLRDVGTYSLWNGYASMKPIPALRLLLGVDNLLDTNPPFSNQEQNCQAGYNPLFSSPLDQTFYGRLTYEF